ncbi:dentin matrix acidic phosphoprotein 1 isoform 2, partial [Planoprotostelium fungivorum]
MPRSFKRKGRKSSTPPAKVARTPQSSERSNSKQVEEDSPSVPSSPTSESADREVASPIGGGEDNEREDNPNQPEAEENDHPPGVMPRSFKRKGRKSSTPPAKVARTPQSSERSNSKQVEEDSPSVPSSPTSESADREVASPIGGGEDNEGEDNPNQPEAEENDHPPGMNRQLFNMINGLQAMVDENRASTESNIDRLKTSLVNVTSLITSVLERLPPRPVAVTATTGAGRQQQVVEP